MIENIVFVPPTSITKNSVDGKKADLTQRLVGF